MENPSTVAEYAEALGIRIEESLLKCIFCLNFLDPLELYEFDAKCLQLVYKNFQVFGICRVCCYTNGQSELNLTYQYSVTLTELLDLVKEPLSAIVVRCAFCLTRLSLAEKRVLGELSLFHKVLRGWRGICQKCMPK